jgi:4-hydroxy-tetrahydrodipicolinate reductase
MNVLVLGKEKTGALIAQIACDRGHTVRAVSNHESLQASGLLNGTLSAMDVVIDFTTPDAVLANISACARAGINIVVGTTGWYSELARIREEVEQNGIGLVYNANFAVSLSSFLDAALDAASQQRTPANRPAERFRGNLLPAINLSAQKLGEKHGLKLNVTSVREREAAGMHTLVFDCGNESFRLTHDAKSQRGCAEGAIRAAEWLRGKHGVYDLKSICRKRQPADA